MSEGSKPRQKWSAPVDRRTAQDSPVNAPVVGHRTLSGPIMFAFFSNRLGCAGSLLVSLVGTVVLFLLMQTCNR